MKPLAFLTIILICTFAVAEEPPAPTEEVNALIEQLGSNFYAERQEAHLKLVELGHKAIIGLEKNWNHPDREIQRRVRRIWEDYFVLPNAPPIWFLPSKYRNVEKRDIGKQYYLESFVLFKARGDYQFDEKEWRDHGVASHATQMYFYDQLRSKSLTKKECKSIIMKMQQIEINHYWIYAYPPDQRYPPDFYD